ncbi:MAG: 3-dehydro-L-gulonate 2-dehydrogenase [Chitinophagaceae bacterium]|nr:3-dehydro-L-gulonate 2-dehydrogenase [Chitinophagaceae bacterium]
MLVPYNELLDTFKKILLKEGMNGDKASICAEIFAGNSRDGVHSHGLNRFPTFITHIKQGLIAIDAEPGMISKKGVLEHWDGHLAPGMYTASKAVAKAVGIAKENGLGMVAVKNTNHWMRGGTYGWQAADNGCIAICGTNSIANMPPWGGKEPTLGNNPLVIAVPRSNGHLVLDMAMSQYSYGKLHEHYLTGKKLAHHGGYDESGQLSTDPDAIMKSKRTLPVGLWKGSGLSLMMDVLVSSLSGGRTVGEITASGSEYGVSQFFICISPAELNEGIIENIIAYAKSSAVTDEQSSIRYPGESTLRTRQKSMAEGVYVNDKIWQEVQAL